MYHNVVCDIEHFKNIIINLGVLMKLDFGTHYDNNNLENNVLIKFNKILDVINENDSVDFDMSKIQWVDLFPLLILPIMISGIESKKGKVRLIAPICHALQNDPKLITLLDESIIPVYKKRRKVCSFLERYDFFEIIENYNKFCKIIIDKNDYTTWNRESLNRVSHVLEISTFKNIQDINSIEKNLVDENVISQLFGQYSNLGFIKSKKLGATVVHELGENISEHSECNSAYISIRIIKNLNEIENRSNAEIQKMASNRLKYSSNWERNFFKNNYMGGYIELVVVDNGKGIYETLSNAYSEVNEVTFNNFDEADVLEWAFEEHSSNKYFKRLKYRNPTGLYWVRDLIKEEGGLLFIRSGKSRVVYDFSSFKNKVLPIKNGNLSYMCGCQYQMIFPLKEVPTKKRKTVYIKNKYIQKSNRGSQKKKFFF